MLYQHGKPKKLPIFFREAEVAHIYDAGLYPDTFEGERDKLLLRILYETGIRRAEVVGLTESSVDLSAQTIKVLGKRNKERVIPIEFELSHTIANYLTLKHQMSTYDEALLVDAKGRALKYSHVHTIVKRYMSVLSNADRISTHVFRHTFATHMLKEGANIDAIKELLGHSSLDATEVYAHVTLEHLKDTYRHAHPRARKKENKQ